MKVDRVQVCALSPSPQRVIAVALDRVPAGYPSPAQDYSDTKIDLSEMLIRDQVSTFIVRVSGESMQCAGISDGDELIVDRSIQPRDGHVVIAVIDGEMTVKRLSTSTSGVVLKAENPDYPDLPVAELSDFRIWGVATTCQHRLPHPTPSGVHRPRRRELVLCLVRTGFRPDIGKPAGDCAVQ